MAHTSNDTCLVCVLPYLFFAHQEHIDVFDYLCQLRARSHDPKFHSIEYGQARFIYLLQYFQLQFRLDIRQEKEGTATILSRNNGMKTCIHTQPRIQRITTIHIHMIACDPAEGLPVLFLKASQIDRAAVPEIKVFLWKVTAYHSHQVYLIVERGSC